MKKILLIILMLLFSINGYCADQWSKDDPLGTRNVSDIDTYVGINNEALDRLLYNYRRGAKLTYGSAGSVTVEAGEVACPNSGGTVVRYRKNTASISTVWTVGTNGLDAGAEAASTTYYIFAVADADAGTFTTLITTSSTAPAGATYYRKLGSFYNDSSSNISLISNDSIDEFGAATTKTINTAYQATTDGYLIVTVATPNSDGGAYVPIYSDANSAPTTVVAYCGATHYYFSAAFYNSVVVPIKSGNYYKVGSATDSFGAGTSTITISFMAIN